MGCESPKICTKSHNRWLNRGVFRRHQDALARGAVISGMEEQSGIGVCALGLPG
jgi:hypothetical protein